jgi:co-chaperonin GroES (HSP10)
MKPTQIKPRGDRVLVELDPKPERVGSIILPDAVKNSQQERFGTIRAVGPKAPDDLKVGSRVAVSFFSGLNCTLDPAEKDVKFKLLKDEDVAALVTE